MGGRVRSRSVPDEDPQIQLILSSWIDRHVTAWHAKRPAVTHFGLDPADSEFGDETVLAAGGHEGCAGLHVRRHAGLMETCAWVLTTVEAEYGIDLRRGEHTVAIDAGGLGAGLVSRLEELGVRVFPVRGNDSAEDDKRFVNRRAEVYGVTGDRLSPAGNWAATPWALPPDSLLRQDLCAPERIYGSDGFRYKITPKTRQPGMPETVATLTEKLGRSPDRGDAVTLLYWGVFRGATAPAPAVTRFQLSTASVLPGKSDASNNGAVAIIAAAYEDLRFNSLGLVILGINTEARRFDLLRCESWSGLPAAEAAQRICDICREHRAWGLAINVNQSMALVQQLAAWNAPVHPSPMNAPERRAIAQAVVNGFRTNRVRLYPDAELASQIAALPIEYKVDGPVLGDTAAGAAAIERGMAFAVAMYWAQGTLTDMVT